MRRRSAVLAVLAVIAAFLGMHSLAMPTHGSAPASATVAATAMTGHLGELTPGMTPMDDAPIISTDAAGASSSDPMVGMACAMALLLVAAGIILMRARVLLTPRHDVLSARRTSPPLVTFAGHPPSLTQLSISRT